MFLANQTRPDITFPVKYSARFQSDPNPYTGLCCNVPLKKGLCVGNNMKTLLKPLSMMLIMLDTVVEDRLQDLLLDYLELQ